MVWIFGSKVNERGDCDSGDDDSEPELSDCTIKVE
jgi:hypothetical protein